MALQCENTLFNTKALLGSEDLNWLGQVIPQEC